ncbi:MAG: septal ring lytic transglycosylase RlpA family protein [Longimicrobiales bacterium]
MRRLTFTLLLAGAGCASSENAPAPAPVAEPAPGVRAADPPDAPEIRDVAPLASRTARSGADDVLAVAHGGATYYADKFDGRRTASGIVFRNTRMYAAHREYPFGTMVRVTNLKNERSVVLRVVDRGPNGSAENKRRTIIDVSQRAARELGFLSAGRVDVRVEVLEWGSGRAQK